MRLFKRLSLLSVLLVAVISLVAGCGGDTGEKKFINIATGGTAGTYYPIGGAIAELMNNNIENMNASAQSTGATVANINMLQDGSVDMAIVQNDITYYAANGIEMFEGKKVEGLTAIASLYPETCQLVTLQDSGLTSVADLRGKRVAVGAMGSGTEANARHILEAYGITYDDIEVQFLSFSEAASALKDGNVDAGFVTAGFPTAAIQDIASQNPVRLIAVDPSVADEIIAKYPFYTKTVIPAGTYAGFDEDVPAVSVMAMLVCNSYVDDQLGYDIARVMFDNLDRIKAAHSVGNMITKESAKDGIPIQMNAGAERYFNGE